VPTFKVHPKIVVLDDDPTGSQTVHSCLLLTEWRVETIRNALADHSPIFFILTNTRSMDAGSAAALTREVCRNLKVALTDFNQPVVFVSRSDSTLRGHFPVETDVMNDELGPFDAHFLIPAFFEGGRITDGGVHYVADANGRVRADETEFAKDSVFGYSTSYLPDYVEEKTHHRINSSDVLILPTSMKHASLVDILSGLSKYRCVAVDALSQDDLDVFAQALLETAAAGKRFLFRSGASILTSLAALPAQPFPPEEMHKLSRKSGTAGVVVVGSHVARTTAQLNELLSRDYSVPVEIDVNRLEPPDRDVHFDQPLRVADSLVVEDVLKSISSTLDEGLVPVVYTSRGERAFSSQDMRLRFGVLVSRILVEVVRQLPETTAFLVSKGGITSNDIVQHGLGLAAARSVGQVIAGCTVVRTPHDHRLADLPVVIFPGNVGGQEALATAVERLSRS